MPAIPLLFSQIKIRANTFAALAYKSPLYRQMRYLLELMLGNATAKQLARVAAASVMPQPGFSGVVNIIARGIVRGKEVSFSASSLKIDGRVITR